MKTSLLRTPLLCLSLLAMAACGGGQQGAQQMPPASVGVITAKPQSLPLTQDLVGRLSAFRSADVRARVAGVLLKRTYDEGTEVKEGQLLFQIDAAKLQAAVNAAQADLAQAQATYTNAHVAAQRMRELAPKGFVSKANVDDAEAAERSAAAAVQAARANLDNAKVSLGWASVRAPISGRAGQQQVTEGALVGEGGATLLTTVDQIAPLYVNFSMSVSAMEQMRKAASEGNVTLAGTNKASVTITLPDGSTYPHPGSLDFSDTTVNPATGAVNLRALIPNPERSLLPGMYVTIKAKLGQQHQVYVLPQQAVQRDPVGAYVMVADKDNKAVRKDIVTTTMTDGNWIVTGGLAPGDKIVVSGIQNVHPGVALNPSPWQAKPATQPQGAAPAAK